MYSMVIEKIYEMRSQFTLEQLDVLIAFFDFHAQVARRHAHLGIGDSFLEAVEDFQLRLMIRRDEL